MLHISPHDSVYKHLSRMANGIHLKTSMTCLLYIHISRMVRRQTFARGQNMPFFSLCQSNARSFLIRCLLGLPLHCKKLLEHVSWHHLLIGPFTPIWRSAGMTWQPRLMRMLNNSIETVSRQTRTFLYVFHTFLIGNNFFLLICFTFTES